MKAAQNLNVAVQLAYQEAKRLGVEQVGTHHALVGMLKAGGAAAMILHKLGVDLRKVRDEMEQLAVTGKKEEPARAWCSVRHAVKAELCEWIYEVDPPHIVDGSRNS